MRFKRFFWPSGHTIRLYKMGCANRPYYQLAVLEARKRPGRVPDEVIGTFEMMENERNERLFAVDCERLMFWMGKGAKLSKGASALLGYAGLLEAGPESLLTAWRVRLQAENPEAPEVKQGKGRYTEDLRKRGIVVI
ncbi:mitochondrial ribosomal protein S16 [Brevipalpus obovatus]|uniref:mitochondrial ribosomal protein S16 n=1 Tax=Brevipalpus obovatus TaxID=246614 RepID=UPI003D9DDA7E